MINKKNPIVSIGMPVYNSEQSIREVLVSLMSQTYKDFELIISDNASTDLTESICSEYAMKDSRVKYVRQTENIGAMDNFHFVLNEAVGRFFMFAAGDDIRTNDFIEENIKILIKTENCVFSSSPNCYIGEEHEYIKLVSFDLKGSLYNRLSKFIDNCFLSHACFYCIARTDVYKDVFANTKWDYLAGDWSINIRMLLHGEFHRAAKSRLYLGPNGVCRQPDYIKKISKGIVAKNIPFNQYTTGFLLIIINEKRLKIFVKIVLVLKLLKFIIGFMPLIKSLIEIKNSLLGANNLKHSNLYVF